ncbi:hypothetical protein EJ05DRAFT_508071 [Pseudovirgaria hyperparasitica]|uniref:Flavin reductase like domain-containing protein n=1 Tax=Pseudovirgaria hyperparasitica TaxID=470096 RepID=A0A6A6WFP2_9PEZI|nr:uncharacterized protein EJ05DRAFT_508071 [Pseudovirgaria hyperparasitica]KAF2760830.1 hypothetical protein EJ05DRAFT_508071 [Pseudovirgaria hyperparasitica]
MTICQCRGPAARQFFNCLYRWSARSECPPYSCALGSTLQRTQGLSRTKCRVSMYLIRTHSTIREIPPVAQKELDRMKGSYEWGDERFLADPMVLQRPREEEIDALRESIDPQMRKDLFIKVFRELMNPVALITAITEPIEEADSGRKGYSNVQIMTISSLTSVTVSPVPYVSFNIKIPSRTFDAMGPLFRISLLVCNKIAAFTAEQFTMGDAREMLLGFTGSKLPTLKSDDIRIPYLEGVSTESLICKVDKTMEVGDHVVVVAEVLDVRRDQVRGSETRHLYYRTGRYVDDNGVSMQPREDVYDQLWHVIVAKSIHYLKGPQGPDTLRAEGLIGILKATKIYEIRDTQRGTMHLNLMLTILKQTCPELLCNLSDEELMKGFQPIPYDMWEGLVASQRKTASSRRPEKKSLPNASAPQEKSNLPNSDIAT